MLLRKEKPNGISPFKCYTGSINCKSNFLIESLNNALINSKDPDQATLRKISENLEYNFELGEGLFENIFLMYKNRDIADGIGGKSVGWEE